MLSRIARILAALLVAALAVLPSASFVVATPVEVTLTTQASADVDLGGTLYDTATLSGGNNPSGLISFAAYGPDDASCAGIPVFTDSSVATGNGSYSSSAFQAPSVGVYRWVVTYAGDDNNPSLTSGCNASPTEMNAACGDVPRVAFYDTDDGHSWFRTNWMTTIVGSEIVKNIGLHSAPYQHMAMLDRCGRDVAYQDTSLKATWQITGRPDDPSGGLPGVFTGFPTVADCAVTDSSLTCFQKASAYWSTLNFVTEVGGDYMITISVPGFHTFNLCIRASTTVGGGGVPVRPDDSACAQPPIGTSTATTLSSSATPSLVGQSVTFTAAVTPTSGSDPATGSVQFYVGGVAAGAPVVVDGSGHAQYATTFATRGARAVTAEFTGTNGFGNSSATLLNQVVRKSSTLTSVVADDDTVAIGQQVAFTVTVLAQAPGSGTPLSKVRLRVNGVPVGTFKKVVGGQATFTRSFKAPGSYTITVHYRGGHNYLPSNSNPLIVVVSAPG